MNHGPSTARLETELVDQITRYKMTTLQAATTLPSARRLGRRRIVGLLNWLCRQNRIAAAPLFYQRRYFHLPIAPGDLESDSNVRKRGALSEEAKIRNYAMLTFCCLGKAKRHRLTATELAQYLPEFQRLGMPLNYYLDNSTNSPRLGFIRVDTGGRGRWDRILEKLRADVRLHASRAEFRNLVQQDAFEVTLITARPQKARRLAETLNSKPEAQMVRVHIAVVPELLPLIAPLPKNT